MVHTMSVKVLVGLFLLGVIACISATNVSQCHNSEKEIEGLSERVIIGTCKKPPCRLRKNTKAMFEMKVTPDRDVQELKNSIYAYVAGVPFPFPGYDETDACKDIYSSDGANQVGCPLKKGEDYLYKNAIDILQIYPRLKVVVHWALVGEDGKDVICFETPARITN